MLQCYWMGLKIAIAIRKVKIENGCRDVNQGKYDYKSAPPGFLYMNRHKNRTKTTSH
jgi:hypothetical protein